MPREIELLNKLLGEGKRISDFLTWFAMGSSVLTGIANPVLLNILYKKEHKPDAERKILVQQEMGKQLLNVTTVSVLFIATIVALPAVLKRYANPALLASPEGVKGKADLTSLLTNVFAFLALTFLSPLLTPTVMNYMERKRSHGPETPADVNAMRPVATPTPLPPAKRPMTQAYPRFWGTYGAAHTGTYGMRI